MKKINLIFLIMMFFLMKCGSISGPEELKLANFTVTETEIKPGQKTKITVTVKNIGNSTGDNVACLLYS